MLCVCSHGGRRLALGLMGRLLAVGCSLVRYLPEMVYAGLPTSTLPVQSPDELQGLLEFESWFTRLVFRFWEEILSCPAAFLL